VKTWCWHLLLLLVAGAALCLYPAGRSIADEKEKPAKGTDEKPVIIQLDLNKLPPDLAKQLLKYAQEEKKGPPAGKAPMTEKKPRAGQRTGLPPGLAKKPADHPGRKAFLEAHKQKGTPPQTAPRKKEPAREMTLPPGLQNKPASHPGRKGYSEGGKQKEAPATPPPAKKKLKKDDDD
jgi:hypothetical protein